MYRLFGSADEVYTLVLGAVGSNGPEQASYCAHGYFLAVLGTAYEDAQHCSQVASRFGLRGLLPSVAVTRTMLVAIDIRSQMVKPPSGPHAERVSAAPFAPRESDQSSPLTVARGDSFGVLH